MMHFLLNNILSRAYFASIIILNKIAARETIHMNRQNNSGLSLIKSIFILTAIYLILRTVSSFFPEARLWGFNQAAFIDDLLWLYPILLVIAIIIYLLSGKFDDFIGTSVKGNKTRIWTRIAAAGIILVLSVWGFYLFTVKGHFLGDGYQLLTHLSNPALLLKPESYGDMLIHKFFAYSLRNGTQGDVYASFRYISIFSGGIFVVSLLYYGHKLAASEIGYCLFVLMNLFSAYSIMFFGYVETYSIAISVLAIFTLSSLNSLKNNKRSAIPIISFALAVFVHKISLVFLPALIVYLLITFAGERIKKILTSGINIIIPGLILAVIFFYSFIRIVAPLRIKFIFLPLLRDRFTTDGYALLSINHILDYLNLLLFLIPISIIIAITVLIRKSDKKTTIDSDQLLYILTTAASGMLAAFVLAPKLGMARDWDLMSTMFVAIQVSCIYLWFDIFQRYKRFLAASFLLLTVGLSIFIPWLAVNDSSDGLSGYALSVMRLDPKHGRTGFYLMLANLENNGKYVETEELGRYCAETFPETEWNKWGLYYFNNGRLDEAEKYFRKVIDENPGFYAPYEGLARIQIENGEYEEALENLSISDAINPYSSSTNYYLGECFELLHDDKTALKYWRHSIRYDSLNPLANIALGLYYYHNNNPDLARMHLNNIPADAFPAKAEENQVIGEIYMGLGDTSKARIFLDRYGNKKETQ